MTKGRAINKNVYFFLIKKLCLENTVSNPHGEILVD